MESIKIEYFYMKESNIAGGLGMVVIGVIMLILSLVYAGGGGAFISIFLSCVGLFMLYRSRIPVIKLYSDHVETPVFKRLFVDIVKIEKQKLSYTLYFESDSKVVINAGLVDKESQDRLASFFDNLQKQKEIEYA